ncbi:MAG: hypothetical protein KF830_00475 [Planctomycetes bacterium]|nr:hypothetical protein [Planctomycetota bacterium]
MLRCTTIWFLSWFGTALAAQAPATTASRPLPAANGWSAREVHRADAGVWYARIESVVEANGQREIVLGDDKGRLVLLTGYSGQWTARDVVCDGQWVAPTAPADVDPRVPGRELYAAGRAGSVHQVTLRRQPFGQFRLESREIGHAAGEEFHAVLAADLVPGGASELLAFGVSGAVWALAAEGAEGAFGMRRVATLPGRVRDTIVVPGGGAALPHVLAVTRSGHLLRLQLAGDGAPHRVLLHEDCGLGRIAAAPDRPEVVYVARDDGVLLRLELDGDGLARREVVFVGPEGLRGVAAGRFFADGREAVAVYGYGRTVHLLSRTDGGAFTAEAVFTGAQRGHWLAVGELDGRNGTDELVAAGFDGQVVLLARVPGHGLPGVAVAPDTAATGSVPARARRAHRRR